MAFSELGVMPEICRAIEESGWLLPTAIQSEAIPLILGGGDVLGAAETGSGKTGAFGIPVLQTVHETLAAEVAGGGPAKGGKRGAKSGGPAATATASVTACISDQDRDAILKISPDGLLCSSTAEKSWAGARGNVGVKSGRYFFEVIVEGDGIVRVGWSTSAASLELGTDQNGIGYGGTAKKSYNRTFEDYGQPYGRGDVIGCYLSFDERAFYFTKNGVDLGQAFSIPGPLQKGSTFFPAICVKNSAVRLNFGPQFTFVPFAGYNFLCAPHEGDLNASGSISGASGSPIALMLSPARDLAEQTFQCMTEFGKYIPEVKSALFIGGVDPKPQLKALKDGVHIAIATPGRLADMIETGKMDLSQVRFFVLDEADRVLETGNLDIIMKIFNKLNKQLVGDKRLQVLLFSATLHSPEIKSLTEKITKFPTWVDLKGKDSVPESVYHLVVRVDAASDSSWASKGKVPTDGVHARDKCAVGDPSPESRSEAIKRLKCHELVRLIDALKIDHAMIFCRTNVDCDNLEAFLIQQGGGSTFRGKAEKGKENRYSCVVMAGWRSMEERQSNLQHFKDGDVRLMICTDVAARGIDIQGLPYVINMTLPDVPENYIHRIGRVGRADAVGLAISFVATEKEKVWFHKCPSKGKGCDNTRLADRGGCTIWYDEPSILREIENRLHQSIDVLPKDFKLPEKLTKIKFGSSGGEAADPEAMKRYDLLRPTVQQLGSIEKQAQDAYLSLKMKYKPKPVPTPSASATGGTGTQGHAGPTKPAAAGGAKRR